MEKLTSKHISPERGLLSTRSPSEQSTTFIQFLLTQTLAEAVQ